jgi:hypothetical protein
LHGSKGDGEVQLLDCVWGKIKVNVKDPALANCGLERGTLKFAPEPAFGSGATMDALCPRSIRIPRPKLDLK